MKSILERRQELGRQLAIARLRAGKTQDEAAGALNVSRATIINFESGKSNPDLFQLEDLMEFYGTDPIYRLKNYRNPKLYDLVHPGSDYESVKAEVIQYIQNEASPKVVRQLLFLFSGEHGRDPDAILQECNAILQIPLKVGHSVAVMVNSLYHMSEAHSDLNCPEAEKPDTDYWESAILAGFHAAKAGQQSYIIRDEGKDNE